jgi:hypothetical protein
MVGSSTVSLEKINECLVSFTVSMAQAAVTCWCTARQEKLVELVALYLVLLFIYPEAVLLVTGLFVLGVAAAF